ncbi:pyridoxamine 5'-phosphate oxidase family protein [Nocardia fluminea]|uniref:pyridoxamine 5'-phosphate oxidase family protein n=1 Tax=Nocardia fluminea TaxID=134984 RepID=UPI0038105244
MNKPTRYGAIAFSPATERRQRGGGGFTVHGRRMADGDDIGEPEELEPQVAGLIRQADSFYLATVTGSGWPYLQHRGGPTGFVHVLDSATIAWAEYAGNNQFVTVGNLDVDDRVALFFIDYPTRTRVKIFGRAEVVERVDDPDLLDRLLTARAGPIDARSDRAFVVRIEAFDRNCTKNITPRYRTEWIQDYLRAGRAPLEAEIARLQRANAELEAEIARLKSAP